MIIPYATGITVPMPPIQLAFSKSALVMLVFSVQSNFFLKMQARLLISPEGMKLSMF